MEINYLKSFLVERLKIRYLNLRSNITFYTLDICIGDYEKIGLTEEETNCIKNRAYTYLLVYKDFNLYQRENLKEAFDENLIKL